jgi:hypothetical protein
VDPRSTCCSSNTPGHRRCRAYAGWIPSADRIPYLFDLAEVRLLLESYPTLSQGLKPEREPAAECFDGGRKSTRQIYRVLGNPHYEHLTQLLEALETCLAHGFKQPRLLKTRARSAFGPDLAELRVAEHFALAGCTIAGFDDTKRDESVPDLLATSADGFRVAVEVYTPMAFEHLERFTDDLRSGVKNFDRPFDFYFDLEFRKMVEFDPDTMKLAYLLPDVLDAKLGENGRGVALARSILDELAERLHDPGDRLEIVREEADTNLRIELELEQIERAGGRLPARDGFIGGPNTEKPAPEWVFARIADNAEKKAAEGQALTVKADATVLVVDLTYSDLMSELRHEGYQARFLDVLGSRSEQARRGHTAVVFAESAGWHQPFTPWFLNIADDAPERLYDLLDPRKVQPRP